MAMSQVMRWAAVAVCATGLSACQTLFPPPPTGITPIQAPQIDATLAAFQRGDYARATVLANAIRQHDPTNGYALLILAEIEEDTGRVDDARRSYAVIVAINPNGTVLEGTGPNAVQVSITDFAQRHMAALSAAAAAAAAAATAAAVAAATPPSAPVRTVIQPVGPIVSARPPEPAALPPTTPDGNIILRFQTLNQLLADGLISQDEYNQRRSANLGALLPDLAPPPAAGLGRPAPSPGEVERRLQALVANYQSHEIPADAAMAERTAVLDALLPATPSQRSDATPKVTDQLQAASGIGRLQRFLDAKIITPDEMAQERSALYAAIPGGAVGTAQAAPPDMFTTTSTTTSTTTVAAPETRLPPPSSSNTGSTGTGKGGNAVKLASYRTADLANAGWARLRRQFPNTLDGLKLTVAEEKVKSGATYYRLIAGPLPDRAAADAVCNEVRARKEYCVPTVLD